jgi:hypothetical protein
MAKKRQSSSDDALLPRQFVKAIAKGAGPGVDTTSLLKAIVECFGGPALSRDAPPSAA